MWLAIWAELEVIFPVLLNGKILLKDVFRFVQNLDGLIHD